MYYINAITSITHQESFGNPGFSENLVENSPEGGLQLPDLKKYIEPTLIRRMSKILRMSVAAGEYCRQNNSNQEIEGIIIGTGLGCLGDTQKFLERLIQIEGLLPPTSFIQSTHNTIAGQVSLSMKNNGYNTTYTQNTISFELALQDAMLCLDEGMDCVLLGAADEEIPFLKEIADKFGLTNLYLTSGVTFLTLSKTKSEHTIAAISGLTISYNPKEIDKTIEDFIIGQGLTYEDLDHVFYSEPFNGPESISKKFTASSDICTSVGMYPTNSAFAVHAAADKIMATSAKHILICNHLSTAHLGLTLVKPVK